MTMGIECHDCRIPLGSGQAYFNPIIDKWVRCLDCHKSMREELIACAKPGLWQWDWDEPEEEEEA